jgi:ABC-type transport system substrate-binding protein
VLWGGIQDKELDEKIMKAVSSVTLGEQRASYLDAFKRVMDKYYFVVAGHGSNLLGVGTTVKGFDTGFTWSQHRVDGGVAFTWLDQ